MKPLVVAATSIKFKSAFLHEFNIYCLQGSKFVHSWHKGCLREVFDNMFQYASNIHCYNTRYTAKKNLYKMSVWTNVARQTINLFYSYTDIWKDLPTHLKNSSLSAFPKKFIHYLLSDNKWNTLPAWHHGFGWARKVIKACEDWETARRLGREQWETACLDGWPFWVLRMPAYWLFHLDQNVHPPIKYLVISYGRVPTDWTIIFSAKQNQHIKEVLTGALSILNIRWKNRAIVLKSEQEMAI